MFGRVLIVRACPINSAGRTASRPFSRRETARGLTRAFSPESPRRGPRPRRSTTPQGHAWVPPPSRRLRRFAPPRCAAGCSRPAPHRLGTRPPGPPSLPDVSLSLARASSSTSRWASPASVRFSRRGCCRKPLETPVRVGSPGHDEFWPSFSHWQSRRPAFLIMTADSSRSP